MITDRMINSRTTWMAKMILLDEKWDYHGRIQLLNGLKGWGL